MQSAWDPQVSSIDGASSAHAVATSLWTEAFVPTHDGPVTLDDIEAWCESAFPNTP